MTRYLFVYGTLREESDQPASNALRRHGIWMGSAACTGRLYNLGAYPGLVFGEGRVIGDLYRLKGLGVFEVLDEYEDFNPHEPWPIRRNGRGSVYVRRPIELIKPRVIAWTYVFQGPTYSFKRVSAGNWLSFRHRIGD